MLSLLRLPWDKSLISFLLFTLCVVRPIVIVSAEEKDAGKFRKDSLVESDSTNIIFNDMGEELPIIPSKTIFWGPGLRPHEINLPARYFFFRLIGNNGEALNASSIHLVDKGDVRARIDCNGSQFWTQILDRRDGSFIIRYKLYQSCNNGFRIIVTYRGHHLGKSPFIFHSPVHPDTCYCPEMKAADWLKSVGCPSSYPQLTLDLKPFPPHSVHFDHVLQRMIDKFHHPASHSFCHYAVVDNVIHRQCYGQHVGFHIFPDAILLFLTRRMYLPNFEFIMNLGDWPLIQKQRVKPPIPVFSWCKSNETLDIVIPTYEITEASLEGMGRVSLDMLTVQSNSPVPWHSKIPKLFWRGRDSRQERLDLIDIARKNPELINASLTNFFFFRDKEEIYGPKQPHVSFFQFFMYKYQLNIDGTVAAYRFPFLLGGDSLVFKTDSPYFEFFYPNLKPWIHYVPVEGNLSDLVQKVKWAIENDDEALRISQNGRKFAEEHLMPLDVICYHATAYNEWSTRLKNPVILSPEMEIVTSPKSNHPIQCDCQQRKNLNNFEKEKLEL